MSETFAEWCSKNNYVGNYPMAEVVWNYRDAQLTMEREAREKAEAACTEPSPCGVDGHRWVDWVIVPVGDPQMCDNEEVCLACQREQAIAAVERERCAAVLDEWRKAYPETIFIPPQPGEHCATIDGCFGHAGRYFTEKIAAEIRSLGPTTALDELLAKARLEEAETWLEKLTEALVNADTSDERIAIMDWGNQRLSVLRGTAKGGK